MQPLMNIAAAAAWLGIPAETLAKLVSARKVPHTRPAGTKHVRFSEEHLREIVAMGEEPALNGPLAAPRLALLQRTHPPSGPSTPTPPSGPRMPKGAAA